MNNQNGATPANGQQPMNGQQFDQYGNPVNTQGGYPGGPQGYPQGQHPGYQQQWQQPEPPKKKKKNFFVRHKILTGLLALVVLIGLGSALAGGGKKDDSSNGSTAGSTKGGETKSGSKSNEEKLPALGTPIKDGDLQFTVTKVERDQASVGDQYLAEKAQGSFTLVYVSVKNVGTKTQTIMADGQKAYDAKGIGYEANATASAYIKGNDAFIKEINPGNTLTGVFVFDAPKGTKLTKVRLHESMISNGVEGSL